MLERELDRDELFLQELRGGAFRTTDELAHALRVDADELAALATALRQRGYEIEERPGLGYRLAASREILSATDISAGLQTERLGKKIYTCGKIGSTNSLAHELARAGAAEGTLVIADHQTRGRGRLGRRWSSPPGVGIWMSLILRPALPPERAPALTLVAAVSVASAVRSVGLPVWVKWPNDVIVASGRKVCGILSEMEASLDAIEYVILGVGINVNQGLSDFEPPLRDVATSLRLELERTVIRSSLVSDMLNEFEPAYRTFCIDGLAPLLPRIRESSSFLGQRVAVWIEKEAVVGQVVDIDEEGQLVLRRDHGQIERLPAREVSRVQLSDVSGDTGEEPEQCCS